MSTSSKATATIDDESSINISIQPDRLIPTIFNPDITPDFQTTAKYLIIRLIRCVISLSGRSKCPKPILKLISTMCLFGEKFCRPTILKSLFQALTGNIDSILTFLLHPDFKENKSTSSYTPVKIAEMINICPYSSRQDLNHIFHYGFISLSHPLTIKRILNVISYLIRKTNRIVWRDILVRPSSISAPSGENGLWLFGILISLLLPASNNRPDLISGNIDTVLHLLEEVVAPLSRVSVSQVNRLVVAQLLGEHNSKYNRESDELIGIGMDVVAEENAISGDLDSSGKAIQEQDQHTASNQNQEQDEISEVQAKKRIRFSDTNEICDSNGSATTITAGSNTSTSDNVFAESTSSINDLNFTSSLKASTSAKTLSFRMALPFPCLTSHETTVLAQFVGSEHSIGSHRKRLLKILRVFSLSNRNWDLLLHDLATMASSLANSVSLELTDTLAYFRSISLQKQVSLTAFIEFHI